MIGVDVLGQQEFLDIAAAESGFGFAQAGWGAGVAWMNAGWCQFWF